MDESFDANQQNLDNSQRKCGANDKTKPLKKDYSSRHRMSDQKWRQNVSKGFAALKTIVKQNRKQSVEQLMAAEGTKEVSLNKKPSMAYKRISRIETLKATIELIETKESIIENLINERQQKMIELSAKDESPQSDKPLVTANGLQKIKQMFEIFEKRHESEFKEMPFKVKKVETTHPKETSAQNLQLLDVESQKVCSLSTFNEKTADPLIQTLEKIKTKEFVEEIGSDLGVKTSFDFKSREGVADEWQSLVILKKECNPGIDFNNNDPNYEYISDPKDYDHSLDTFRDCSPVFNSFSSFDSLDNKSFVDYSYSLDPKDYLTTDLTEHLAITMPLSSFGPSLTYLTDSYI